MGADLYIKDVDESQGGYFRDNYNDGNVLNVLGASWWRDISRLCNQRTQKMSVINVKKWLNWLEAHKVPEPEWFETEWIKNTHKYMTPGEFDEHRVEMLKEEGVKKIHTYFTHRREQLLTFIRLAIEQNKPITCSL